MSDPKDLETRLRAYLTRGAEHPAPRGLDERLLTTASPARSRWAPQLFAAAAVVLLAIGVGLAFENLRSQKNAGVHLSPTPTPQPSVTASATPTETPKPSPTPSQTPQPTPSGYPLLTPASMRMIDARTGWAAGTTTDRILRTTDGGAHWAEVGPRTARAGTWTPFFLDANNAWFASSTQPGGSTSDFSVAVYRTADGGRSWQPLSTILPDQGWPRALDFVDRQHGWLMIDLGSGAGSQGVAIYATSNGGATWAKLSEADNSGAPGHLPVQCSKSAPVFLNTSTGWLPGACNAGGRPFLLVTRDGGRTWNDTGLSVPASFGGVCMCEIDGFRFVDARNGSFVLNGTGVDSQSHVYLYATHDGGATWRSQPMPRVSMVMAYFVSANQGFALDAKTNTIHATGDGGANWSARGLVPSSHGPMAIDFVDANVGWVMGSEPQGETLIKTTNGGQSWSTQLSP